MHTTVDYTKAKGLIRKEETGLLVEMVEGIMKQFIGRIGLYFVSGYEEDFGDVLTCSSLDQIDARTISDDCRNIREVVAAINAWFAAVEVGKEDEAEFPKITYREKTILVSIVAEEGVFIVLANTPDMQDALAMVYGLLHAMYLIDTLKAYVRMPAWMLKVDVARGVDAARLSTVEAIVDAIFSDDDDIVVKNWQEWRDDALDRGFLSPL